MAKSNSSLLMNALDRAEVLAISADAAPVNTTRGLPSSPAPSGYAATPPPPKPSSAAESASALPSTSGAGFGGTSAKAAPPTALNSDGTISYLDDVTAQLAQVQSWLRSHPSMLKILDEGIRQEVRQMERRVNVVNIITNLGFTVLGTILGLFGPAILAYFGGR